MSYRVCSLVFIVCSAMTEKIVGVLKRMRCPHRLEPHQIQGLDFIHIYPVVQVNQFFLYYDYLFINEQNVVTLNI